MPHSRLCSLAVAVLVVLGHGAPAQSAQEDSEALSLRFSANAQALGAAISGMARVEITLSRWSTAEEGATLEGVFLEQGQAALVNVLQGLPEVGRIRVGTELSYPLQFAEATKTDTGWMVFIATDREIGAYEAYYNSRTLDHSLGLIQLVLDEDGNGEGTVVPAVRLAFDRENNTLVIEDWDTRPVKLRLVRLRE